MAQSISSAIAQSVAESLLGSNAAAFTRSMKSAVEDGVVTQRDAKKLGGRAVKSSELGTARDAKKDSAGANDVRAPKREISGSGGGIGTASVAASKGGRVVKSGRVKLHRGEVVRKKVRSSSRGGGR